MSVFFKLDKLNCRLVEIKRFQRKSSVINVTLLHRLYSMCYPAETLVPEPSSFEVGIVIENLKRYKSPGRYSSNSGRNDPSRM